MEDLIDCPLCSKKFKKSYIEEHANKCLFLNTTVQSNVNKRSGIPYNLSDKRLKVDSGANLPQPQTSKSLGILPGNSVTIPLAERMRPIQLDDLLGHRDCFGEGSMLRSMLEKKKIPNLILYGPPGCGKTSMGHIIANLCKNQSNLRFIKLSAAMSGIADVKEVVKVAKNETQYKRQTVLFMDEIHRFNKLQQDSFLPHVENGTIILIGATTENPSFSLNNALLSRCKVVVMEKLTVEDVLKILERTLTKIEDVVIVDLQTNYDKTDMPVVPRFIVERDSLKWVAEVCDGDARIALGALELALEARAPPPGACSQPAVISLDDIKSGIKRSHMLYDKRGEEHYNTISALQKSIRASDDNAALYWTVRALHAGEDPLYIARRLVRTASEDIGLADRMAVVEAVSCLHGCQHIGMPECDVLLAQCAVRLARAPKSREVYYAMKKCQQSLKDAVGPLPPVPLHLRNAPTKLMERLGYGKGYNTNHKDISGLTYLPEGMEDVAYFNHNTNGDLDEEDV